MRDRVNILLLSEHNLIDRHRKELEGRGLTRHAIDRLNYKSWGVNRYLRVPLARAILAVEPLAIDVPGIAIRDQGLGLYPTLTGGAGIALPVRDVDGKVQSLTIKADDLTHGKYLSLSSAKYGGASPGTPIHLARPTGVTSPRTAPASIPGRIVLTEGVLKADIAAELLGLTVIGLQGVGATAGLGHVLGALQAREEITELVVALDMDYLTNPAVAKARAGIAERVARAGIPVLLGDWAPECKGLDDLLVAGGRWRLTPYQVLGNGRRPLEEIAADPPSPTTTSTGGPLTVLKPVPAKPPVTLAQAWKETSRGIVRYLNRNRRAEPNVGLLLAGDPGTGKSHALTTTLNDYLARHPRRSAAVFVARHEQNRDTPGREDWRVVRGRAHVGKGDAEQAPPCGFPGRQRRLVELRIAGQAGCAVCPQAENCKTNQFRDGLDPFYLNQLEPDAARRVTVFQAGHFTTPTAWSRAGVVVLDDVAIRDLQLEPVRVSRPEIDYGLAVMAAHPDAPYALGQPLLHLVAEATRRAPEGEFSLSGPALIARLLDLAKEHGITLADALQQARKATEPDPFPAGSTLTTARLNVPKRFLGDLTSVLAHELQQAGIEREVAGWSSRVEITRELGGDVYLDMLLRRELPLKALAGKDLVISDGSTNAEELNRLFPFIERWVVIKPDLLIPASVKVVQFTDRAWGKRALHDADMQGEALEHIRQLSSNHPGQTISLVTYKFFAEIAKREFPDLLTANFYGQRGSNKLAKADVEIIIGTPRPNPRGFMRAAHALHWDEEPLNPATVLRQRPLGATHQTATREYVDPRLAELSRAKTTEELVQAIGRIRPFQVQAPQVLPAGEQLGLGLWPDPMQAIKQAEANTRRAATVYVLSNHPIPGIKVELRRLDPLPPRPDHLTPEPEPVAEIEVTVAAEQVIKHTPNQQPISDPQPEFVFILESDYDFNAPAVDTNRIGAPEAHPPPAHAPPAIRAG